MGGSNLGGALRQLDGLFEVGTVAGLSDGQLLERYLVVRDQSAFAALVMRHGPMVLGVCRAVLKGSSEVEDAFQATFLVLVRKAGTIRGCDAVGGWLHRVAHRVAVEASRARSRRDRRERGTGDLADRFDAGAACPPEDDWRASLHDELTRLPERLRQPIVLCYLEGKTHAQAALELKWSEATLRRRLADARGLLRSRLTGRGVAVPAALFAAAISSRAEAAVPPALMSSAIRAAAGTLSGNAAAPAAAVRLARSAARGLLAARVRGVVHALIAVIGATLVAGHLIPAGPVQADDPAPPGMRGPDPRPRTGSRQAGNHPEQAITVRGRILAPDGKPVAGARVFAHRRDRGRNGDALFAAGPPVPSAVSASDGQFQFTIDGPAPGQNSIQESHERPIVAAFAKGFGPAWDTIGTADAAKDLTLTLVRDDVPISGRIIDLEGRPVPGVTVRPVLLSAATNEDLSAWEAAMANRRDIHDRRMDRVSMKPDLDLYRWSKEYAAITDTDGRFRMTGIGRERVVSLWLEGPAIASEFVNLFARTRTGPVYHLALDRPEFGMLTYYGATFGHAAAPTRPIEGIVRDRRTGRPLSGISIWSDRFAGNPVSGRDFLRTTTGPDGRFRLLGMPRGAGNVVTVNPRPDQPYLGASGEVPDSAGLSAVAEVNFDLQRGVLLSGKVTDKATGKPVPASVEYFLCADNPHRGEAWSMHGGEVQTRADGTFELIGLPGRGLIAARAARDEYLVGQGADKIPGADEQGSFRTAPRFCEPNQWHTIVAIDPAEGAGSFRCDLTLDPGVKRTGTLLDPDGRPLSGCVAINLSPHTMSFNMVTLASSDFTALALEPGKARPLTFRHNEKKLTALVMARGEESGPLTVRLQPAGTVTGRLVDAAGEPRHDVRLNVGYTQGQVSPRHEYTFINPTLGDDGRFRIEGLIPGVSYDFAAIKSFEYLGTFGEGITLKPGESRELGDVQIRKPAS